MCFLQPTSPLRTSIHIDEAYDYFNKNNLKGLISGYYPKKNEVLKSFKVISHGMIEGLISPDSPYTRRQDLPKTFMSNGALYLFKPYDFKYENKIPRSGMNLYEMSKESSLDIDTYNDLNLKYEINMKNPFIDISGRRVGLDYEPLVIAEIGINHEGSLKVAKEMVDAAIKNGAENIKHQTHIIEDEMSDDAKKVIPGNADVSIYQIMERCALNEEDEKALKNYIEQKGAIFLSTPFSRAAALRLERMGVSAYKIGSGECNNYPLLNLVASFKKPIILSTGMNDINSIKKSVKSLETWNKICSSSLYECIPNSR